MSDKVMEYEARAMDKRITGKNARTAKDAAHRASWKKRIVIFDKAGECLRMCVISLLSPDSRL
jgi:hypothetical protein